jgi:lysozyme
MSELHQLLKASAREHEGLRLKPYLDCCGRYWRDCACAEKGKLTVGYGRNLDDVGISMREADMLLDTDVDRAISAAGHLDWFGRLDLIRQWVISEMVFNMGLEKLLKFKRMLTAMARAEYATAAAEMLDSAWKERVKGRAIRLAEMMRTGKSAILKE